MATPAIDQTYGQRSVFGTVGASRATAPVDDDLECEDEQDALAYLMGVRSEASKIPNVLVARRAGPQAFPPGFAAAPPPKPKAKKEDETRWKRNKRRQRHWDDQDEVYDEGDLKRRRTTEISYDEVNYDDLYDDPKPSSEGKTTLDEQTEEQTDEQTEEPTEPTTAGPETRDGPDVSAYDQQTLYETGVGDARGYYDDGAYVAAGDDTDDADTAGDETRAATDDATDASDAAFSRAFRARMLVHFSDLRAALAAHRAVTERAYVVGPLSARSGVIRHWLQTVRTGAPDAEHVAGMDKVSVLRLLRIVQRGLALGASTSSRSSRAGRFAQALGVWHRGGLAMDARTMQWLWALLAQLPGRGELDYREIGYVRDVAKQAVLRLAHLSLGPGDLGVVESEDGEDDDDEADEYEYEAGEPLEANESADKAGSQEDAGTNDAEAEVDEDVAMDVDSELEDADTVEPDEAADADTAEPELAEDLAMQQRAALEMVLGVVGELYGQRDLLEFPSPWPAK